MKTCAKCKISKKESDFSMKKADRGWLQPYCIPCNREHKSEWYKKNKKKVADKNKDHLNRNKRFVLDYLSNNPCVDCGEQDLVVLEFDHVSGTKRGNVTALMRARCSLETLKEEIDKCEVVCANCHKRRTYKDSYRIKSAGVV